MFAYICILLIYNPLWIFVNFKSQTRILGTYTSSTNPDGICCLFNFTLKIFKKVFICSWQKKNGCPIDSNFFPGSRVLKIVHNL